MVRDGLGGLEVVLKGRQERLKVSRSFRHLFNGMEWPTCTRPSEAKRERGPYEALCGSATKAAQVKPLEVLVRCAQRIAYTRGAYASMSAQIVCAQLQA